MSNLYMGIDVGKAFCEICVLDEQCVPVYCDRIDTLCETTWHTMLGLFEGHTVHAAFEIGSQYEWLYDLLAKYCVQVDVVNADAFALVSRSQKKTDKVDALKLAEGIWRNDLPTVYVPKKSIRKDRRLIAHLHNLSQAMTSTKSQIRNMLFTAKLTCPYTDVAGNKSRLWFNDVAIPRMDDQDRLLLTHLLEQLKLLASQQHQLEKIAFDRTKSYEHADVVQSIPGFGILVSLGVLCGIAENSRFRSADHLASYFGLCGRISQSGKSLFQGRITKRGNSHVRWLLGQAVTHLIRRDARARARYLKLKKKKKAMIARVALMRWIITVLWHMLAKNEKFRLNGVSGNHYTRRIYIQNVA
jgi:transposase